MLNKIIKLMIKLNKKAINYDDVPVSCVIVKNNKIIAYDYNKKNKTKNPLAHAEILTIKKAAKKLNAYNLNDCELYVTLCPCNMCKEVIKESRIKKVYYILEQKKTINDTCKYEKIETDINDYFSSELSDFFNNKR